MIKKIVFLLISLGMVTSVMGQSLYEKNVEAAKQGDAEAQYLLGKAYQDGDGIEKNMSKALLWYKKSSDQENADATFALGMCYYNGEGVPKDFLQAGQYFHLASGRSHPQGDEWYQKSIQSLIKSKLSGNGNANEHVMNVDQNIPLNQENNDKLFAVIIGNENYENEAAVPFAEHDAKIFREYVKSALGVPEKQIRYVQNGGLNNIRISLRWLRQAMEVTGGKGRALFYYAGHGIPDEASRTAFLLPTDGISSDPESGYSLVQLYDELNRLPAQQITVFIDACFNGAKRNGGMLASARGVAIKVKQSAPKGNMIVFTAAQGDETAGLYQSQQHGMFTYFLLRKLKESKGECTLGQLSEYVQTSVKRQSVVSNRKSQTPTVALSDDLADKWKNLKLK